LHVQESQCAREKAVRLRLRVLVGEDVAFGPGKAELLAANFVAVAMEELKP